MPTYNNADDNHEQAELISEPRAEYKITPEAQAEKETYRKRLAEYLKDPAFLAIEGFPLGTADIPLGIVPGDFSIVQGCCHANRQTPKHPGVFSPHRHPQSFIGKV